MNQIIPALFPIFALILIGYGFKRISFPAQEFWPMADRFTYFVLIPSLLIYKLAIAPTISADSLYLVLTTIICTISVLVFLIVINLWLRFDPATFTSIVQGGIRFNTYVFFALADAIYGDAGLISAVIVVTFIVPTINILCISVFSVYIPKVRLSLRSVGRSIITNPLIIACFIGASINLSGMPIPSSLEKVFMILSNAALPLGLLSVGVGLHFSEILACKLGQILSNSAKLIFFPIVMWILAGWFQLDPMNTHIVVIFGAMPTAISSYILARQMGGNTTLMSSIITVQTLASFLTIAIVLELLDI